MPNKNNNYWKFIVKSNLEVSVSISFNSKKKTQKNKHLKKDDIHYSV